MHTICELIPNANSRAAFPDLDGKVIHCARGNLWVTVENVPGDRMLAPGESLRILARGKMVIGGLGSYTIGQGAAFGA